MFSKCINGKYRVNNRKEKFVLARIKNGFTLVELLVVISIIAFLLSILLPALSVAKFQAKEVLCKSNMRQWAMMSSVYAGDYEGKLPRQDFSGSGMNLWDVACKFITYSGYYLGEETVTYHYGIKDIELKYCPLSSAELIFKLENMMDYWNQRGHEFTLFIGYGWCVPRSANNVIFPPDFPAKLSDHLISQKPILVDVIMKNHGSADDLSDNGDIPTTSDLDIVHERLNANLDGIYATHIRNDKVVNTNLAFGDCHVETHKPGQIKNRYNASLKNLY